MLAKAFRAHNEEPIDRAMAKTNEELGELLDELRAPDGLTADERERLAERIASFGVVALDAILADGRPRTHAGSHLLEQSVAHIRDLRAIPRLLELLLGDPTEYRTFRLHWPARDALIGMGPPAVAALTRLSPERVDSTVVGILGAVGGDDALKALTAIFETRPVTEAALAAAHPLAQANATGPLERALGDHDERVRRTAVDALAVVDPALAFDSLARSLGDPSAKVREATARALMLADDDRAVPILEARRNDPDRRVRAAVHSALGRLTRTRQ